MWQFFWLEYKMSAFCPISGDRPCKCDSPLAATDLGAALLLDVRAVLRKLFTDHVVYVNWLIFQELPAAQQDNESIVERLATNIRNISDLLTPIIGNPKTVRISNGLREHLNIIYDIIEASEPFDVSKNALYANGDAVADALADIKPGTLPASYLRQFMTQHNTCIYELIEEQVAAGVTAQYIATYDKLYQHTLALADAVYGLLSF